MKFDRSKIFKMAWNKVRVIGCSLSEALRDAWIVAKKAIQVAKTPMEEIYRDIARKYTKIEYPLHEVVLAQKIILYLS